MTNKEFIFSVKKSIQESLNISLEELSKKLTAEFENGFDESNLRYMRLFYHTFKNCDTLRHELKEKNIELF